MSKQFTIRIRRREDGRTEILYSTLEEFEAIWQVMTKGCYIVGPDGAKTWVAPKDVFIEPDGEFRFKPKKGEG